MSKKKANSTKRRRSKTYTGEDAAVTGKTVQRISVPDRSKAGQWWHDNKKKVGLRAVTITVLAVISFLIYSLVSWIF